MNCSVIVFGSDPLQGEPPPVQLSEEKDATEVWLEVLADMVPEQAVP
jgi:hypothetical protein